VVAWAGVAGIGLILVPVLLAAWSALTGGSRQGVSQHRSHRVPPTYPFAASPAQRRAGPADQLEAFWADGQSCSIGCRAPGVVAGWPLQPFHGQHALRAGLNEQRKTSFHHGIDIQAYDNSPVYAIQPGRAQILQATGGDSRVLVGNFIYWHIHPLVRDGQRIEPYRQVVGTITPGHGHLHLSELDSAKRYVNPLRPGGRALEPYSDTAPPVIDRPRLSADGQVIVRAFDPQSFQVSTTYKTPVIAPAALAYRIFDQTGQRLGPIHWALRGSQNLEWTSDADAAIYATGSRPELANCFERQAVCQPNYIYVIAGGLAPPLTQLFLPAGQYRVTVYAWDWAGNTTARDAYFTIGADGGVAG
jgi:murein DD-endopeptidase MepM/ murein hydrolase activator NlpD